MEINGIELKKGNRIRPVLLLGHGFRKLSKYSYVNEEDIKITIKSRKIIKVEDKPKFSQLINDFKGSGGNSSHSRETLKMLR